MIIIPNYFTCLVLDSQRIVNLLRLYHWQNCIKICIFTLEPRKLPELSHHSKVHEHSPTVNWSAA